jgi:hypothetical protein
VTVAPGHYRLQIDAHAERGGDLTLSDAVSIPVSVITQSRARAAR